MKFGLKPKSVALYITGKKYFRGKDKKAAIKYKAAETTTAKKKKQSIVIPDDDSSSDNE